MAENETNEKENKDIVELRKEKIKKLFGKNNIIYYIILLVITWLAVFIRTLNVDKLKDVTTNSWTLGPDLDPFLFLRWAEYIVAHGKLMVIDTLRYVPLGYDTSGEMKLLAYMIAWFYDILIKLPQGIMSLLPGSPSQINVTYAAILFPVIMFGLTCIVFFFLVRKIFYDMFENKSLPNIISLIATFFLAVMPPLLPRTIAGIPEKESVGFLFIFLSFYFLISMIKSKKYKGSIMYGLLAGISTAILGLVWGGVTFVFMTASVSVLIYFLLGQFKKKELLGLIIYVATFMPIMMIFSNRNTIMGFLTSTSTMLLYATILFAAFDIFIYLKIKNIKLIKNTREKYHIPEKIISLIIVIIVIIIAVLVLLGPNYFISEFGDLSGHLVHPLGTTRFGLTVAENKQPYFVDEWKGSFGPVIANIPLFFWLFIVGSVVLFYYMLKKLNKKDKWILSIAYVIFILCLIFSRYSSTSSLNGESSTSLIVYFGGMLLFIGAMIYIYYNYNKNKNEELLKFEFGQILIFALFIISIVAARGAVRLVMMLVPTTSIMVAYLIIITLQNIRSQKKDDMTKIVYLALAIIVLLASLYSAYIFYETSKGEAQSFYPSFYTIQWQNAMSWVRNNTSENAVFGHWWDYGYWVQSIGKRATVLDGGNAITYWDYLMGREVLTTTNDNTAFQFLYTHNTTHLLIDSTDIGKYPAFSSIGSDENYDRYSYIPTFFMDSQSTKETQNGIIYFYNGGVGIDEDIVYENNGSKTYLTTENTGLGGILIEQDSAGNLKQPIAIFVQQGNQIQIPLRYMYYNKTLKDFGSGIDAGVFIIETVTPQQTNLETIPNGALFYLSKKTVHSLLVRKYLFEEEVGFRLIHNEPNIIISELRRQGAKLDDFVYYQGNFLGPIKIWEIQYPKNVQRNESYLVTSYPNPALEISR